MKDILMSSILIELVSHYILMLIEAANASKNPFVNCTPVPSPRKFFRSKVLQDAYKIQLAKRNKRRSFLRAVDAFS